MRGNAKCTNIPNNVGAIFLSRDEPLLFNELMQLSLEKQGSEMINM